MATALATSACAPEKPPLDCSEDRCDAAGSREELLAQLGDNADPIAAALRALSTEEGTIEGDYNGMLDELGAIVGCDASSERGFVVLSNADFIPKTVFSRCSDSPQLASQFFVAAPNNSGDDMDPQTLHLSGWDDQAKTYRHYATAPTASGAMSVNVAPTFCLGCHGGPEALPTWQPLMNEMTNPWSGWNAEPGFASQLFDEYLDGAVASGRVYGEMLSADRLDSASNLEPLVRAGIARTVSARALTRNEAAARAPALELVRPLFCDESVNYVSEIHESGELRLDAIVDQGLRDLVAAIDPQTAWSWQSETSTRLAPLEAGESPVTLVATRGTATVELERALLARGLLAPLDLLRLRALDWQRPVASEDRCALFREGRARIEAESLAAAEAALDSDATVADLAAIYLADLLSSVPALTAADATRVGQEIEAAISLAKQPGSRAALRIARDERGCWASSRFLSAPIIPDLDCP